MAKTALLVGISGLGRALHHALAPLGYTDAIITYQQDRVSAEKWAQEAKQLHIETKVVQLDSTDSGAVQRLIDSIDRLDAVVAMQGKFIMKPPLEYTDEELLATFASNYFANYNLAKSAMPKLRETKGSFIVFGVAHADQLHSQPMTTVYAASKTALLVLMRSLARSEAKHGVRINMISPGLMQSGKLTIEQEKENSKSVPMGRSGTPEDVAGAVKYLLSDEAQYVTGTNIILSGGWAI